jgi:hypothetical protein
MSFRRMLLGTLLITTGILSLHADEILDSLKGTCRISASTDLNRFDLRLDRDKCENGRDCHEMQTQEPADAFTGITLSDLQRDGAHIDAVIRAEAGTFTCSGSVHDSQLTGEFVFAPNKAFVDEMAKLGITGFDFRKLEAYTLFRIEASWVKSLQTAGVTGINSSNLIAMRIFKVEPEYIHSLAALGYTTPPPAEKLIALKVHGVDPGYIKQVRAMGYNPTLDELIQMRVFKITPEFIQQMKAKGFNDLTISKLVQIKIFKLDE